MHTVLTFGYQRQRPEALAALAEAEDALVVDVRIKPSSRVPRRSQKALQANFGDRYVWVRELGNEEYQGTGVRLVDEEVGLAKVRALLAQRSVILLYFEEDEADCHRGYVKEILLTGRSRLDKASEAHRAGSPAADQTL